MGVLYDIFVNPFVQMATAPDLLVQTLWEGLVAGVLYALIALGFVLIFKASGVFNFAQGIMVVFAALTYFLIGFGELLFGGEPKVMIADQLFLPSGSYEFKVLGGFVSLQKIDIAAAVIASLMVGSLAVFFQRTRIGRALRAVADSHRAALSVGIPQFMLTATLPIAFALEFLGEDLYPGDVLIANDPYHGGGHLPDYNVFAPVFADDGRGGRRMVLIASIQCHHGDTGGGV